MAKTLRWFWYIGGALVAALAVTALVLGIVAYVNRSSSSTASVASASASVENAAFAGISQLPQQPAVNTNPQVATVVHLPPQIITNTVTVTSTVDSSDPCDGDWPGITIQIDYLIVGGGPAGLQTADDLSKALRATGLTAAQVSVAVVEKRAVFGGNLRKVALVQPSGYSSTSAQGYGPLQADVGAQRVNILTLTNERRLFAEHNITMYCTPFRNIVNLRERREVCDDPMTVSGNNAANNAFAYSDFCTYRPSITDPETGAYKNVRIAGVNFSDCSNYGNAGNGNCTNFDNNDPSFSAYEWLLQGNDGPAFDLAVSNDTAGDYYFYDGNIHPLDPDRSCTVGTDCPIDRCRQYADWRSFVAGELSLDTQRYNDGYANFLQGDNVGFLGDYEQGFGACSYSNYQAREWNTAAINCYPKGGMTSLTDAQKARALSNGAKFYANEPVKCVKRNGAGKYKVRTATKTFMVNKFLFLAAPTPSMEDPKVIGGDVMDSLRQKREFKRARSQRVASVVMQWAPGVTGWWLNTSLFDEASGQWSARTYGDTGCFSRIEIIDTPQHRCTNAIRAIYSDWKCRAMWTDLIEKAAATGNWTAVRNRVLVELRDAFPEAATIPLPVLTYGEIIDPAWYWGKPEYDDISNEDHAIWAATPLTSSDNVCLTSESVHIYYQGWTEGALRSSRQCLQTRFPATSNPNALGSRLRDIYRARDLSPIGDGSWASANFQDVPPAAGEKHFPNEEWWPFDYSGVTAGQYCNRSLVAIPVYPVTDAGY